MAHPRTIYGLLESDHQEIFQKLNRFYDVLNKLRYEGKIKVGRNLAETRQLASYFESELKDHMKEEERALFPFLRAHIPRLEPIIYLLLSEHNDFRRSLKGLRDALIKHRRAGAVTPAVIDTICERGTYLICLLRSHMWCESHSLYKAADSELHADEKRELLKQIKERRRTVQ